MKILKITTILALALSLQAADIVLSSPKGATVQRISELVLKEAYKNIGVPVTFVQKPGERSLKESNGGKVDGEVSRVKAIVKKYKNLVMVPVAINYLEGAVFTKNKKFDVKGWDSIKPYKIGLVRGSKFVEKATKGMNTHPVSSYNQAFKLLDKGRVDIVVTPYIAGITHLKEAGIKDIVALKPSIVKLNLYHFLHTKNSNLVPKLEAELKKMQSSGRIKEIREKFVSSM